MPYFQAFLRFPIVSISLLRCSYDDRLKKILPTSHTVEMKEQVERHIALLEKRLTAGIGEEELRIFSDVLKKMQENMELTERGNRYG
jgi:DNA-binding MarR family transcriptional regulator